MYVVRDIFRCRPGQAKELIRRLNDANAAMKATGTPGAGRVLVDVVAEYWTVVLESEIVDLSELERHMAEWGKVPAVVEAMKGYIDLVEGGRREIFRVAG